MMIKYSLDEHHSFVIREKSVMVCGCMSENGIGLAGARKDI